MTCAVCGRAVTQPQHGRRRRYCTPTCRREAEYRVRSLRRARFEVLATAHTAAMYASTPYAAFYKASADAAARRLADLEEAYR